MVTSSLDVSRQLHARAALPSEKKQPVAIGYETGWAPEPVWTLWSTEEPVSPTMKRLYIMQLF
jgi:hypothetical protein